MHTNTTIHTQPHTISILTVGITYNFFVIQKSLSAEIKNKKCQRILYSTVIYKRQKQ